MSILAAVNDETDQERIVKTAADLARAFDEELVVLHALPRDVYEQRAEARPDYYADRARDDAIDVAQTVAGFALDDLSDVSFRGQIGDPSSMILDFAEEENVRYTVIGGRKRTPTGKAIFGSVAQSVLLESDRPVVTVMERQDDLLS